LLLLTVFNQAKQFLQAFAGAVCAASAFGFAVLAIRLSGRVRLSTALLLVASIALIGFSLWYYASRLIDLKQQ
jgi:hypothetical protein